MEKPPPQDAKLSALAPEPSDQLSIWKIYRLMVPNAAALRLGLGIPRMIFNPPGKEWGLGKPTFSLAHQKICC
jgi:hypothetical protein